MIKVSQLMTSHVHTVSSHYSVQKAAALMRLYKVSCLIILKNGKPQGIITERDIVQKSVPKSNKRQKVRDVMSWPVITASPNTSVLEAATMMKYEHVKQIPVVEQGKVKGIITQTDIIRNIYDTFYLASFSKKEMVVAFVIFLLMLLFLPSPLYSFIFLGFIVVSQMNVIQHFLVK